MQYLLVEFVLDDDALFRLDGEVGLGNVIERVGAVVVGGEADEDHLVQPPPEQHDADQRVRHHYAHTFLAESTDRLG